jgi:hypothetical protein
MRFPSGLRVGGDLGCPMGFEIPAWAVGKVRVNPVSGCWEWTGANTTGGYGKIWLNGRHIGTHRAMYVHAVGAIPDKNDVCHHCDNPPCINPEHLFVATRLENIQDSMQKGRRAFGERSGMAKLTDANVLHARVRYANGDRIADLAREFDVGWCTMAKAVKGHRWKHLQPTIK